MAKIKYPSRLDILSIGLPSSGADAITVGVPIVSTRAVITGALPCNREFRAEYECRVELCLNPLIVKLVIIKTCQYIIETI
jgi:hypothetical protein